MITGKIGKREIVREEINSFIDSLKEYEWTDNNIYKTAKTADIRPTFNPKAYTNGNLYQKKNVNFDQFIVETNSRLSEFERYKYECENRRTKLQDEIAMKRKEFIEANFPRESVDIDKKDLLELIKTNKMRILLNDPNLKPRIDKVISSSHEVNLNTNSNFNAPNNLMNNYGNNFNYNPGYNNVNAGNNFYTGNGNTWKGGFNYFNN